MRRTGPLAPALAGALSLALAVAVAGCAAPAAGPAAAGTTMGTERTPASAPDGTSGLPAVPSPATPAPSPTSASGSAPTALPTTFTEVDLTIEDPDLGHRIVVTRIARDLPWPPGYKASAQTYELVGVEMKWTPGVTYTAKIRVDDLTINTGGQFPNRPDPLVNATLQNAGWALLPPEMPNGQSGQGWVVFKVAPRKAPTMVLEFTRPASRVTDNAKTFPRKVFTVPLPG